MIECRFQWNISFSSDPTKPEEVFSRNLKKVFHQSIIFNDKPLSPSERLLLRLRLLLDSKFTFKEHIKNIFFKINKSLGLLHKFQMVFPVLSPFTICKTFIFSYFEYANVVCDQCYQSSFHEKLERIQCSGTSSEGLYQELTIESLQSRRQFRKLNQFYKVLKNKSP